MRRRALLLITVLLLFGVDARAARSPRTVAPPPPIAVDTHDLYPEESPWWWRYVRFWMWN